MKTIQVKAVKRENYGKKAAKAVRREGQIPAVLYGGGETVSFSVDPREIKPLIYTPNSYIVDLEIDGKTEKAVLRDVQFHPIREEILHMDFYRVQPGKPVAISIPVRLTGNAEGVKIGGKLVLSARKLTVSAQLDKLPDELVYPMNDTVKVTPFFETFNEKLPSKSVIVPLDVPFSITLAPGKGNPVLSTITPFTANPP